MFLSLMYLKTFYLFHELPKFKYFALLLVCVYANAQFNLCAKRLCGHQTLLSFGTN